MTYQGRTISSTTSRKDGSRIQAHYYACGGYVMKGRSTCEKFLLRKEPLESLLMEKIQHRLGDLLAGEGESVLRQFIEEEISAQGADPRREMDQIRARIAEIDQRASVLSEGLSEETRGFVDDKLRDLAAEKRRLQRRFEEQGKVPYEPIDAGVVLRHGMAALRDLPHLLESGSLEETRSASRSRCEKSRPRFCRSRDSRLSVW